MSQARNKRRNNIRAGIFVSISILLGLVVFTVLTSAVSRITTKVKKYKITFTISEGIGTLSAGSKVRLGGVLVGDVLDVSPRLKSGTPTSYIDVTFQLDSKYTIYSNATIYSRSGLLGDKGWLSISDVGNGEVATLSTLLHGSSESMVSQLLGRDAQINISKSLVALRKLSEALTNEDGALTLLLGQEESQALQSALASLQSGLRAMDSILDSTETVWPTWEGSVTSILVDSKPLPNKISDTLAEIHGTVHDVRVNILPSIDKSMQSFESTMASLDELSKTFQESSPIWASKISTILNDVQLVVIQAKSAIADIQSDPWRLIYRPTDRDIKYEQLNAASWQLLSALSDLRVSAQMLEAVAQSPDAPDDTSAMVGSLQESVRAFEHARSIILERMKQEFPEK